MFYDKDELEGGDNTEDKEQENMFSDNDAEVECDSNMLEDHEGEASDYAVEGIMMMSTLIKYDCHCGMHYEMLLTENGLSCLPIPVCDDEGSWSADLPVCIWTETVDNRLITGIHCTRCKKELHVVQGADFIKYWCTGN